MTTFGYSGAHANGLTNWYWGVSAAAMLAAGTLSDRLVVRKPLMAAGGIISAGGSALLAVCSTRTDTGHATFVAIMVLAAVGNGLVFAPWLAAHTETVERRNPAATAAGLAVWSIVNKLVVTAVLIAFMFAVTAPSILIDSGTRVQAISTAHPAVVTALTHGRRLPADDPIPAADLSYLKDHLDDVTSATRHGPQQWQRWWWVCVAGQLAFIPLITLMAGRWRPSTARIELHAHARQVTATLHDLRTTAPASSPDQTKRPETPRWVCAGGRTMS
jgi:MFS family permease